MSKRNETDDSEKRPIDMNTDEALEYVFGPEIADELKREAGKCEPEDPNLEDE